MKNSLITRLTALMTALLLIIVCVPNFAEAAGNDGVTLCLHYDRPDDNYEGWSVWFWVEGSDAADVPLQEENGEMVARFSVPEGASSVGFIVKQPNWAAKDVDKDQFVDVAACLSGTVHVSVKSGVEGYEMAYGEDVITGIKVKEAVYREGEGIRVSLTQPLPETDNGFTLTSPEGNLEIASVTAEDGTYVLETVQPLDLLGVYTLTCQGAEYTVRMPNVYSTEAFENTYTYTGEDLGATWSAEKTAFRLWAPTAASVKVSLYESGTAGTEDLLEQISTRQTLRQVNHAVNTVLTPQERTVIILRYGLGGRQPKRQREVAAITGISRSYVSRIETRALDKLKRALQ